MGTKPHLTNNSGDVAIPYHSHNERTILIQSIRNTFRKVGFNYEEMIESIEFTQNIMEQDLARDHRILESVLYSMFGIHAEMILRLIDEEVLRLSETMNA